MSQNVDISCVPKFNGMYFNIWKHKSTLIFKTKKPWLIVSGAKPLPIAPIAAKMTTRSQPLLVMGRDSIIHWKE